MTELANGEAVYGTKWLKTKLKLQMINGMNHESQIKQKRQKE